MPVPLVVWKKVKYFQTGGVGVGRVFYSDIVSTLNSFGGESTTWDSDDHRFYSGVIIVTFEDCYRIK